MLNKNQLKNYRLLKGLSTRDVAAFCDVSQPLIVQVENGTKRLTEYNHDEIVKGINAAYKARVEAYRAMRNKQKEKSTEAIKAAIEKQEELAKEEPKAENVTEITEKVAKPKAKRTTRKKKTEN